MFATINTKTRPIYVQDYYANGRMVKVTLTPDKEKQNKFSGEKISGPGVEHDYGECYSRGPNYKPLMAVRDILKSKDMSYLGYKSIDIELVHPITNERRSGHLPSYLEKYKGIKGKNVTVIDLVNNVTKNFVA